MRNPLSLMLLIAAIASMLPTLAWTNANAAVDYDDACANATIVMTGNGATKYGTDGNDIIRGTNGNDIIFAKKGNDIVCGLDGHDFIVTADGDDIVYGGPGNDDIYTGNQEDTVYAGTGEPGDSPARRARWPAAGR